MLEKSKILINLMIYYVLYNKISTIQNNNSNILQKIINF